MDIDKKAIKRNINSTGGLNEPWLTRDSINIIELLLKKHFIGLEYGCGSSTIWFSRRIKDLTSIEHDKFWYKSVSKKIKSANLNTVNLLLKNRENFEYADYINKFPPSYFHFILIDGRDRVKCIKNAITTIKPNGFLILDDSERFRYNEGKALLKKWAKIETHIYSGKTTTIWLRNPTYKILSTQFIIYTIYKLIIKSDILNKACFYLLRILMRQLIVKRIVRKKYL